MDLERQYYSFNTRASCPKGCKLSKAAFLGKSYTVVPVSMIVSGAYYPGGPSDSKPEALFFEPSELEKSRGTWNGRPAALGHPKAGVTMNEPDAFDKHWLGFVFNTEYDAEKERLTAQLWLDDIRGDDVINRVSRGDAVDVSIGAFGTVVPEKGEAAGVEYSYKYTDIRGDHLAVLPDSEGACGWSDGCGIRAEKNVAIAAESAGANSKCSVIKEQGVVVKEDIKEEAKVEEPVKSVTCEDVLGNPEKYDSAILDAIKMRDNVKAKLVSDLVSVTFEGGPLCTRFLDGMNIAQLSSLKAMVNHYEAKLVPAQVQEAPVTAEARTKAVNYSLNAVAVEDVNYKLEPAAIEW